MRRSRIRRVGAALALTAALAAGGATVTVHAATTTSAACSATQTRFCELVARSIQYLEGLKPSPLRDALLKRLHALESQYCTTC